MRFARSTTSLTLDVNHPNVFFRLPRNQPWEYRIFRTEYAYSANSGKADYFGLPVVVRGVCRGWTYNLPMTSIYGTSGCISTP